MNLRGWPTFTFVVKVGPTRSAVAPFRCRHDRLARCPTIPGAITAPISCISSPAVAPVGANQSVWRGQDENRNAVSMSPHLYKKRKGGPSTVKRVGQAQRAQQFWWRLVL